MTNNSATKRELARKRIGEYRDFFRHIKIFVLINGLFYVLKRGWLQRFLPEWFPEEAFYFDWVDLNIIIWGLMLIGHALYLYRRKLTFLRNWEERQIRKYMDEENAKAKKYG